MARRRCLVGDGLDVVSGGAVTGSVESIDVQCWLGVIIVWRLIVACCGLGFGGRVWVCGGYCIGCRFAEWRSFVCALWRLCVVFTQDVSASVGGDLSGFAGDSASLVSGRVFGRVGVSARLWRVGVDGLRDRVFGTGC